MANIFQTKQIYSRNIIYKTILIIHENRFVYDVTTIDLLCLKDICMLKSVFAEMWAYSSRSKK